MSINLKGKEVVHLLVSGLLSLLLIFAVSSESSFSDIKQISSSISAKYFSLFLACSMVGLLLRALRYRILLRHIQEQIPGFGKILLVTGVRNAFVDFLPARLGEASYLYFMNRMGVSIAAGVATFGLGIVLDLLALIFVAVFFSGVESAIIGERPSLFLLVILALGFLVGLLLLWHLNRFVSFAAFLVQKLPRSDRAAEFLRSVGMDMEKVNKPASVGILLLVTVMLRIAKYGGLYLLTLAVLSGWDIGPDSFSPVKALGIFILSEASASLPVSGLMGFGLYEGVWSTLFRSACGPLCANLPATTIAFAVHLLSQLVGYSVGLLCLGGIMWLLMKKRQTAAASFAVVFCMVIGAISASAEEPVFVLRKPFPLSGSLVFSAEYKGTSNIYLAELSSGSVKGIGPGGADNSYPAFSPDGEWIAFSRGKEGARGIGIVRRDGSGFREIVPGNVNSDNPSWSSDGRSIVFYREKKGDPKVANLFLVSPETPEKPARLTKFKGRNTTPQWAPDGRHIAFSTDRFWPGWDVCVLDMKTRKESCPFQGIITYCRPRYDHSGKRLAYSSGPFENVDIYIRNLDRGTDARVTSLPGRDYDATWSPDDVFIAFTNNGSDKQRFELFVVRVSDGAAERLLNTTASVRFLSWTTK